jgi:hypothetical protein
VTATTVFSALAGSHSVGEGVLGFFSTREARALRLVCEEARSAVAAAAWGETDSCVRDVGLWAAGFGAAATAVSVRGRWRSRLRADEAAALAALARGALVRVDADVEGLDAASRAALGSVKKLTLYGADGHTPLTRAARAGDVAGLRAALAEPQAGDAEARGGLEGRAALAWAASTGSAEAVALLLAALPPADVNARDARGWAPLDCARAGGHAASAAALVAAGAQWGGCVLVGHTGAMRAVLRSRRRPPRVRVGRQDGPRVGRRNGCVRSRAQGAHGLGVRRLRAHRRPPRVRLV